MNIAPAWENIDRWRDVLREAAELTRELPGLVLFCRTLAGETQPEVNAFIGAATKGRYQAIENGDPIDSLTEARALLTYAAGILHKINPPPEIARTVAVEGAEIVPKEAHVHLINPSITVEAYEEQRPEAPGVVYDPLADPSDLQAAQAEIAAPQAESAGFEVYDDPPGVVYDDPLSGPEIL